MNVSNGGRVLQESNNLRRGRLSWRQPGVWWATGRKIDQWIDLNLTNVMGFIQDQMACLLGGITKGI